LKKLTASFRLRDLKVVALNKNLWLASFVVLAVYTYQSGLSIFGYYLQNSLFYRGGVLTPFIIFLVLACRAYLLRTIFSPSAGKIADKYKKYLLTLSILLTILFSLGIIAVLLPGIHAQGNTIEELKFGKAHAIFIQITAILIDLLIAAIC
jgi:hypothetical protein